MDSLKSDDLVGQTFLHYQVTERLGAGGMGVVYRALDLKLRRTVALKFLPSTQAISEEMRQRFMREAMTASAVDHPNVGTLHAVEETPEGLVFLVMACYAGPTLGHRIAQGPIPAEEAVSIALQVARGLGEAHKHGIVHRDIKPGNIIFHTQGQAGDATQNHAQSLIKILDFGLAKLQDGGDDLTLPGTALGTASYMAPEQAMGQPADGRADLWSLGVVFYEMLIGVKPFSGGDLRSTLFAVISKEPTRLADLPLALQNILSKALQKDPDRRYQTAQEMIADLEALRGSQFRNLSEESTIQFPAAGAVPSYAPVSMPTPHSTILQLLGQRRVRAIVAFVLFSLLGGAGAWWKRKQQPTPSAAGTRVAVLPLSVTGGETEGLRATQALANGLRSQLIETLASQERSNSGFLVIPAAQIESERVSDAATANKNLGANLVLTGSFSDQAGQLRVVLSLVDGSSSNVLKSEVMDGSTVNLAGLSDRMAKTAEGMLGLRGGATSTTDPLISLPAGEAQTYLASVGYFNSRNEQPGNLDLAIAGFQQVLKGAPNSAAAYAGLADAQYTEFINSKDAQALGKADESAARAVSLAPNLPEALLAQSLVRTLQGRYSEAISGYQRVLTLDDRNDQAYRGLARAYVAAGLPDKAEEVWQKAVALRPNSVGVYNNVGAFEMTRGRYAAAADDYRKAVALAPANATLLSNLGAALLYAGSLDESRRMLQESIRLSPNYASYTNLGNLDLKQKRYADAAADYEKALELNKSDYNVWSNLAVAYSQTPGQQERAKDGFMQAAKLAREALKTNPNDPETLSDLAMFIASEGSERQEPLELIEKALALAPQDTYVQFNAAETYESIGYRKEALDWLGKLIAAGYPLDDINNSPVLADLIKDKRYQSMLEQRKSSTKK